MLCQWFEALGRHAAILCQQFEILNEALLSLGTTKALGSLIADDTCLDRVQRTIFDRYVYGGEGGAGVHNS